jgi:hypothetical protein
MAFVILEIVTLNCMDILIQIGMVGLKKEKHFRMLFQFGVSHDFVGKHEEVQYFSQYGKRGVHCSMLC